MRLRIATPCDEDWTRMTPRAGGRHCAACDRVVVDLSAQPPDEARRTLARLYARAAAGERVCARGPRELPPAPRRASSRRRLTNALATVLAMTAAGALASAEDAGAAPAPAAPTEASAGETTGTATPADATPADGGTAPAEPKPAGDGTAPAPVAEPKPAPAADPDAGVEMIMGDVCVPPGGAPPDPGDQDYH